jgi:hypothetical protein
MRGTPDVHASAGHSQDGRPRGAALNFLHTSLSELSPLGRSPRQSPLPSPCCLAHLWAFLTAECRVRGAQFSDVSEGSPQQLVVLHASSACQQCFNACVPDISFMCSGKISLLVCINSLCTQPSFGTPFPNSIYSHCRERNIWLGIAHSKARDLIYTSQPLDAGAKTSTAIPTPRRCPP